MRDDLKLHSIDERLGGFVHEAVTFPADEPSLADGLPGGVFATKRQRRKETEESKEGTNRALA